MRKHKAVKWIKTDEDYGYWSSVDNRFRIVPWFGSGRYPLWYVVTDTRTADKKSFCTVRESTQWAEQIVLGEAKRAFHKALSI